MSEETTEETTVETVGEDEEVVVAETQDESVVADEPTTTEPDPPRESSSPRRRQARQKTETVGVCTSCQTVNSKQYLEGNSFWREGKPANCQFCGGVVVRAAKGATDRAVERARLGG